MPKLISSILACIADDGTRHTWNQNHPQVQTFQGKPRRLYCMEDEILSAKGVAKNAETVFRT